MYWTNEWNNRTHEAGSWLRRYPNAQTPDEIGSLIGSFARQRWLGSLHDGFDDDFSQEDPYMLAHFAFSEKEYKSALIAWKCAFGFIRISIDSQIIIDMDRENYKEIHDKIMNLNQRNLISVSASSRFRQDKNNDKDQTRVQRHLFAASKIGQTVSVFRCDESLTDCDVAVGSDFDQMWSYLGKVTNAIPGTKKYINQLRDGDHLYSHIISNRDYFLTRETRMLTECSTLPLHLTVVALEPGKFLAALDAAEEDGQCLDGMTSQIFDRYLKQSFYRG